MTDPFNISCIVCGWFVVSLDEECKDPDLFCFGKHRGKFWFQAEQSGVWVWVDVKTSVFWELWRFSKYDCYFIKWKKTSQYFFIADSGILLWIFLRADRLEGVLPRRIFLWFLSWKKLSFKYKIYKEQDRNHIIIYDWIWLKTSDNKANRRWIEIILMIRIKFLKKFLFHITELIIEKYIVYTTKWNRRTKNLHT